MADKIEFLVIENGLDFVLAAVEHLSGNPTARDLKYAVLDLSAGLELLLKARLQRQHWSLVFQDISKANEKAFKSGDFYSVGWKTCIERLEKNCGVKISKRNRNLIENLRKRRNMLEHFGAVDSAIAIKASTAKVLSFIVDFTISQFDSEHFSEKEDTLLNQIRRKLGEFEHFVGERMKAIQKELDNAETVIVECPRCVQPTMIIDDGGMCKFCGYSAGGDDAAGEYVHSLFGLGWHHVADGGEIPIYRCPECWMESLVDIGNLTQELQNDRFVCFSCANTWGWGTLSFCGNCGNPFLKDRDGLLVCNDCFDQSS